MSRSSSMSQNKRRREQLKQDKRRAKDEKRAARKEAKQTDGVEPADDELTRVTE